MTYPGEPWHLKGRMHVSVWLVPAAALPAHPQGLAAPPLRIFGRVPVGAAWVSYEPGGVLTYRELLSARLVRDRGRVRATITEIWVDSEASRDGGRELWGIPKDLADLVTESSPMSAGGIARAVLRRGVGFPGRVPLRLRLLQMLHGRPKAAGVRGSAALRLGRVDWEVVREGPLGYLGGRRPLVTLSLTGFDVWFGSG
ncbi:acetoacetate decarboxylase family protein [Catenuloplanes japonicus]|uniref:acetoacetate decarboxylase family protein n=1 Tax=Catenuloplanes japonicus TaxID=33876 RepID=UPI001E3E389C|nr:acetoacetate decarboxylase family protein [Catenuloplanes japonicus]